MDFKGEYVLRGGKNCYPLSMIDDHSRFSVGLYGLPGTSYQGVRACVIRTFQEYGVPEAMLMDHGVPWWGSANRLGLTRLSVDLMEQGIRLYYSGVGHPQTQGKVGTVSSHTLGRDPSPWRATSAVCPVGTVAEGLSGGIQPGTTPRSAADADTGSTL